LDYAAIFVDTNVPIYAWGRAHELKEPCAQVLGLIEVFPQVFVTDAEVLQELLHRYRTSAVWTAGRARIEDFAAVMRGRIEPLYDADVLQPTALADRYPRLSARDLVHLAVMNRLGIMTLVSGDADFDAVADLRRLDPREIATWRAEVG
jgi:predicted nucleic acid-binding protein